MLPIFETTFSFQAMLLGLVSLPLVVAVMLAVEPLRRVAVGLAPWAALPAVLVALFGPQDWSETYDWLFLGTVFELDPTARVFLVFVGLIWWLSGLFSLGSSATTCRRARYFALFLLTMSGNIGVVVARDLASFLLFFSLMGLSSYGLVAHRQTEEALGAARVYMSFLIISEVLLFAGAVIAVAEAPSLAAADVARTVAQAPRSGAVAVLLLAGFGIKAGFVPLHMSLPPAYRAAPASAAAVLSGATSKAGLLGWMLFLPVGIETMPALGLALVVGGLVAVYFGIVVGLLQSDAKAMLAYSSISQIGFMTLLVGVGALAVELWPAALTATLVYALHHGLNKGALFLSVRVAREGVFGPWRRRLVLAAMIAPALALAGAPLTAGAAAKHALKEVLAGHATLSSSWFVVLVSWGAVGTALLMVRFLEKAWPRGAAVDTDSVDRPTRIHWLPWGLLVASGAAVSWILPWPELRLAAHETLSLGGLFSELWPLAVAVIAASIVWRWGERFEWLGRWRVPAGDVLAPLLRVLHSLHKLADRAALAVAERWWQLVDWLRDVSNRQVLLVDRICALEEVFARWHTGAIFLVILLLGLIALHAVG